MHFFLYGLKLADKCSDFTSCQPEMPRVEIGANFKQKKSCWEPFSLEVLESSKLAGNCHVEHDRQLFTGYISKISRFYQNL